MASREHWEMDITNWTEVLTRVIGKPEDDPNERLYQAKRILGDESGGVACLEIGAGYGRLLPLMKVKFDFAMGVDSSLALTALSTHFLRNELMCRVVLMDGKTIPSRDNNFDFVYSFTCFQHIPDLPTIRRLLQEALRVLKPGGKCRIQNVVGDPPTDGFQFKDAAEFMDEFVGFKKVHAQIADTDSAKRWVWVTGEK